MHKELKGLDDFFAARYTPEDLLAKAVPADLYLADLRGSNIESSESFEWGSWAPPTSLDASLVPPFPVAALPKPIETYTRRLSVALQTPLALASGVALGAMSVALAKKIEVKPRAGWVEPLVLWTLTLLPSGERKTAVMNSMRGPLDVWEREKRRELAPLIAEAESRREILVRRKKKAEEDAAKSNAEEDERDAAEIARELAEHEVPSVPQLTTSDVTAEAAAMLCAENGGRIAIWSDEAETVKIIAGRYARDQSTDVEIYLKGHAGGYYSASRVSRDSVSLWDPAIPMVLSLQPEAIRGLSNRRALHGQGFFARILYALPPGALGGRTPRPEPVDEESYEAYSRLIEALLDTEAPENEFGETEPHTFGFSEAADKLLEDFQEWVEPQLGPSGAMASYREWGSKLPGAVVRIAGVLHAADRVGGGDEKPWETPVARATLKGAIEIGCFYLDHAKATMHEMEADPRIGAARHVLDALEGKGGTKISKRDLFQKVRWDTRLGTMRELEPVIELLKDYGYLRELETKHRGVGRPRSNTLEINPLPPTQNTQNTQNLPQGKVKPFFAWLEERRGPEDPEDPPPSGSSPKAAQNGPGPEGSAHTTSVDADTPSESDAGEDITRKNGHEDASAERITSESELEKPGNYELVTESARLSELASCLQEAHEVALDVETTGLNPREHRVRLLTLATEHGTWLIDCFTVDPRPLFPILTQKRLLIHNALFDLGMLMKMGFEMGEGGEVTDPMLTSLILKGPRPTGKEDK